MTRKLSKKVRYVALPLALAMGAFAIGVALPLDEFAPHRGQARPIVIDDVGIVDLEAGVVRTGQTIVVIGNRIDFAGPAVAAPAHPNARRVSGAGKFAMPGLWDMHVHTVDLSPQLHFPLLIANGVTSVRDMGDGCAFKGELDCAPTAPQWGHRTDAGTLLAPRLVSTASHHVEEAGEGLVGALKKRGDKVLKLHFDGDADPKAFHALVRQAYDAGMQAAGHLPHTVDLLDPQLGPLHSIEHDTSLLPQCSPQPSLFDGRNSAKLALLRRADAWRCAAVLKLMAQRGIGYVPTHIASSGQDWQLLSGGYKRDARVKYVPLALRMVWRGYAGLTVAGTGDEDRVPVEAWYKAALALTARAQAAGVAVMAGSDSIDAYVTHGFGLHDELSELVKAGLTPLQALRAATLVPARHAGLERDFGSVEAGKIADIVLLDRNPLENIAHARAIDAVVYNGKLHQRPQLDAMLSFVEEQASSFSINCKFAWAMLKPW
ncbi:amidohydrolase family protein [Massilia glaciei]|uniref:amidohydrolase family protein n=1 Tax=Massilia glaciei TaxID=1524097 RepID=UPI0015E81D40|nr:amidohydrolase family protein [Massilia glaciei]